jgi:hypothetical protein
MASEPTFDLPDGWEVDNEQEGGQPNGGGEIEPSDSREWYTAERETHHRRVITLIGPWEKGPTQGALIEVRTNQRNREAERVRSEDLTLMKAREIIARRTSRGPT